MIWGAGGRETEKGSLVWWRSVSALINQKYQQNISPLQLKSTLFNVFSISYF